MVEAILLLTFVFVAGALVLSAVKVVLHILFGLIFLPFKLIGALLRLLSGFLGLVLKGAFSLVGLVVALLATVFVIVVIPLLPFLLVGLGLWLLLRHSSSRSPLRLSA